MHKTSMPCFGNSTLQSTALPAKLLQQDNAVNYSATLALSSFWTQSISLAPAIDLNGGETSFSTTTTTAATKLVWTSKTGISFASTVIVTCFLIIVIGMTVVSNSVALAAFLVSRKLRKITYYFIVNLCISDLTVAILSVPFWISFVLTGWPNNKSGAVYTFWLCLDIFCGSWSIMCLAMISIERYVCIVYSLHYPLLVTKQRAFMMVAFVLFYSSAAAVLGALQSLHIARNMSMAIFVAVYVVPVLIKIYTYAGIYKEVRRQKRFMNMGKINKKRFDRERQSMLLSTEQRLNGQPTTDAVSTIDNQMPIRAKSPTQRQQRKGSNVKNKTRCLKRCRWTRRRKEPTFHMSITTTIDVEAEGFSQNQEEHQHHESDSFVVFEEDGHLETSFNHEISCESEGGVGAVGVSLLKELSKDCCDNCNGALSIDGNRNVSTDGCSFVRSADVRSIRSTSIRSMDHHHQKPNQLGGPSLSRRSMSSDRKSYDAALDDAETGKRKEEMHRRCNRVSTRSRRFFKSDSLAEIKNKSILRFQRFQREVREAKMIGLIIGTFLSLWTPFMLVVVLSSFKVAVSMDMIVVVKCLHYANSATNPILYVLLNKIFRQAVRKVFEKAGLLRQKTRTDYD